MLTNDVVSFEQLGPDELVQRVVCLCVYIEHLDISQKKKKIVKMLFFSHIISLECH